MGKQKKTRKFAVAKKLINPNDPRLVKQQLEKRKKEGGKKPNFLVQGPEYNSAMYMRYNTQLGPPYRILLDTNFLNFSVQNKLDVVRASMDCLFAKCIPCVTDCVLAELEKLGHKYRVALRVAKDPRFERLPCTHQGTYADDCLVQRCEQNKCYIVATADKDLKRRLRKIPGVPIMYIKQHKYVIERMPDSI